MNVIVDRLIQFVGDYLVLSTIWLALGLLAQRLVRSPALRVACGWCVCAGLAGLFVIAAWADRPQVNWPRIASVPLPLTASVKDPVGPTHSEFEVIDHEVIESIDESVRDSDTASLLTDAAAGEFTADVKPKRRTVEGNPLVALEQSVVAGKDLALWDRPGVADAAETGVEVPTIALGRANDPDAPVDSEVSPSGSNPARWEEIGRPLLCAIWLGAAIVAVVWLALGSIRTGRLKKNSWPAPEWLNRELTEVIGTERRRPQLALSAQLDTAVALDAMRPMIVMPSRLVERGSDPALSAMLAHEVAHIRQGDLWLLAVQRCLLPLLAAQPLYWWFRRGLSRDQELLADAEAARGREVDYAAALLAWVRTESDRNIPSASWSALAFWPEHSLTTRRIEMLLDTNTPVATTTSSRSRLGLTVLSTVALCLLALLPVGGARGTTEAADVERSVAESESGVADTECEEEDDDDDRDDKDEKSDDGDREDKDEKSDDDDREDKEEKTEDDGRKSSADGDGDDGDDNDDDEHDASSQRRPKTEMEADDDDDDDDDDGDDDDDDGDDDDDEKQKSEKRGGASRMRENASRYETVIQLTNPKAAMKSIDKINQSIRRRHPKVPGLGVEAKLHASGEIHLSGSPGEVAMLEVLLPLIDAKVSEREEDSPRRAPRAPENAEIPISELSPQARVKLLRIDVAAAKKELEACEESVDRTQKQVEKGIEPHAQLRAANRELEQARFRLERLEVQLEDLETRPEREARAADEAAKLRATQRAKRGTARLKLKELDLRSEEQEFDRLVEDLEQAQKLRDKGLIPETELQVKRAGLNASRQKVERARLHLEEAREELESDSDLPVSR